MAEKAKGNVEKKKRIRDGQRSTAARLLDQVKQRLNDDSGVPDRQWTKESLHAMKEKVEALKRLDNQIIDLIGGLESEDLDAQIENEIEESDRFRRELNQIVVEIGGGSEPQRSPNSSDYSRRAVSKWKWTTHEPCT